MLSDYLQTVDWSRAQFAMTAIYHWLFVPLTLGLSIICAIMETIYYRTGDPFWKRTAKFWMRLFGINFAIGVATGLILEFEFGTNWSNYSHFVGDIFGAPLAIEGILAFFLESTFVAVMFFGWNRVSRGFHLSATWLTAVGANLSALWILVANSWMQYPVGCTFNIDTVRNEMTSFWDVLLSPVAVNKFTHTVTSSFVLAALFVCAVCAWYLLRGREQKMARKSIAVASVFGLVFALITAFTGDRSGAIVARVQPMKLAALEALYDGEEGAALTAVGILRPEAERSNNEDAFYFKIAIPKMLSLMSFRDADAFVPGINDLVNGNPQYGIMPTIEKIERGRVAIAELERFKQARETGDEATLDEIRAKFDPDTPRRSRLPERVFRLFRLRLPRLARANRTQRTAAFLLVPPDGRRRVSFHPGAGCRLVVQPQGHARTQALDAVGAAPLHAARLPGFPGRLDRRRSGPPALGDTGSDAGRCRRFAHRQRLGRHDLLHLPGALRRTARGRNQHSLQTNQDRT